MNRIKELREKKGIGQKALASDLHVSQPTICDWETGRKVPSSKSASKLADYFGVSLDYLLGRDADAPALTIRDNRDIAKTMESLREQLLHEDGLMFDGDPLSPEAMESILSAMKLGLEAAKQRNKEKYTPNKYKAPRE